MFGAPQLVPLIAGAGDDVAVPVFETDVAALQESAGPSVEFDDVADGGSPFVHA